MANNAHITGVFADMSSDGTNLTIPIASVHSLSGLVAASGDIDLCFGLIDSCAKYLAAAGYANATATESDRIVDSTTLRKDYTFRINLEWDSDTATATMDVK